MKRLARRQFGGWADSYDRSLLKHFLFEPSHQTVIETICRQPRPPDGRARMLDVGCGTGTLAERLINGEPEGGGNAVAVDRVVGLDYALPMCRQADAKARRTGRSTRLSFVNGDSEHLPFADACFDLLTCANSFHHYPHQARVIAEFRRVLRPGGQLIVVDGFRDNVIGWFVFDVCIASLERAVYHATWSEIRRMALDAGFSDVVQRKFNFWFPALLTIARA